MFGNKIKTYINNKGITQSHIAEKAGIPINTFNAMMNNKRKITVEEYVAICNVLEVDATYFCKDQRENA